MDQWTPANKTSGKGSKTDTRSLEETILRNVTSDTSLEIQHDNIDDRTPLLAFLPEDDQDSNEASFTNWEKFAFGSISGRVYWTYARALGYCLAAWVLISLALMQGIK